MNIKREILEIFVEYINFYNINFLICQLIMSINVADSCTNKFKQLNSVIMKYKTIFLLFSKFLFLYKNYYYY